MFSYNEIFLTFISCVPHICATAHISQPQVPQYPPRKIDTNITMLGTAICTPAGAGLNPTVKG
jgi:hypothetical protein